MKFNIEKIREISKLVRELSIGLTKLSFANNFVSFEKTLVIPAGSEIKISNPLTFIPSKYIIVSQIGNGLITKSNTWDTNFIYLTNNGAVQVSATVIFFK